MIKTAWKRAMLGATLTLSVCIGLAAIFGRSRVGEFNPYTLAFRVRPAWGFPCTSSDWRVVGGPSESVPQASIVAWLVAQGYWAPTTQEQARWMRIHHYGREWRDGHGGFVWNLVLRETEWKAWTAAHSDWAPRFWARVLETLRSGAADAPLRFEVQLMAAKRVETWEAFLQMEAEWMAQ